jgi:CHAT domain-containing protein
LIALNDSLTHLNRAVALDSTLVDAYFNRALALEALRDTEEAKAAWRRYIEVDPSSKWTDEARQHLQRLENSTPKERSAKEIEEDFLAAYKDGRSSEAEKLIASNREAIRDKYLPVRLAMSFVSAGDERRDELLKALEYCGEIEMKMTGDPFAKEIAFFYHNVPRPKLDSLAEAHRGLRDGYDLLLNRLDYRDALPIFQSSQKTFDESGDVYSAKLAQYFVAYALANLNHNDEALSEMTRVSNWAGERKFSWLSMTALHWVASCQLNSKQLTEARRSYEQALAIAETIGDSYGKQRNLSLLAYLHSICGQQKEALKYLFASVKESDTPETSLRQRYRNLFFVLPILIQAGLFSAGEPAAIEAMKSADRQNDAMWMTQSRALAGIASAQMGDLAAARAMLDDSRSKAAAIQSTDARERMGAFARLRSADFERLYGGDLATAERLYKEALQYYDAGALPSLREEARQGLLQTYLATGNSNALAAEIPANISLDEEYRTKILDEEQTISFFDLKANVYDVAAEFEFNNGNLERAYDHVEASSSRALLNRMQRRSSVTSNDLPPSSPLNLSEIRAEMPAGVRIVQYSVFEKKVVVWIVSRDGLNAVPIPVDAVHLSDLVSRFSQGVSNQATADSSETKRLGVELYELLILPILSYLDPHDELCIIPSKFLFDVPFAALTDSEGKPLISTFRLVHAPSANVFLTGSRNAAARQRSQDESLLAVGNPAFDRERFENLTYLPDSEQETERIARLYPGAQALIGERATKKAFLNALSDSDVIHFAGHYVAMPGTPMASFLLLATDGGDPTNSELSNSELLGMSLSRARLIVLAACRSGIESYYRSEGMAGMSRTMLAAQVPLVVASQWSVDSAATAAMMIRFLELRRQEHMPTTAALRAAQLDLINDPSGKYSSPYYWAAFAVYGGHAEF